MKKLLNFTFFESDFLVIFFGKSSLFFVDKERKIMYNVINLNNIYVTDGFAEYRVGM